jgi:hypothetical protein
MLIYRSAIGTVLGSECRAELEQVLSRIDRAGVVGRNALLEALLRAGALECALADADHPQQLLAARLCDGLASRALGAVAPSSAQLQARLRALTPPTRLRLHTPEGYAYYGVTPARYAGLALSLGIEGACAVLGVRSIGTSLSASVAAALRAQGGAVERLTVRPSGHPWQRTLQFSERQRAVVERARRNDATFLIVDEGPGMSGSTFLAVAEALERRGVGARSIQLLCSHAPDPTQLRAPHAAERFARYRRAAIAALSPPTAAIDVSAGAWRAHWYACEPEWPACWAQRERTKWLSLDGRSIDKFEGLPPYAAEPLRRAQILAEAGYGPTPQALDDGFVRYARLWGRPASARDLQARQLTVLARYCAFRSRAFALADADMRPLTEMLPVNVAEATGLELDRPIALELARPTLTDARMQPHEWILGRDGALSKTDGHSHGDDHFLPGPSDVAWDLAGAIVEWRMSRDQRALFLAEYERHSGDRIQRRLPAFLAAYCALRVGEATYAADGCGEPERARLLAARELYRAGLMRALSELGRIPAPLRAAIR